MISLKKFYEDKMEKNSRLHQEELNNQQSKIKEEYIEWKEDFLQKQKDELREKLKEMRDQVKRERNEEINVIVNKLSSEAFDTEKALIAKFDRKEKEVEAKYRTEIMELKERIEALKGKSDAERRTKEMLEENLDITSKRLADNDQEINEKSQMIENLKNSIKNLTEKLNSLQSTSEVERARFERDEIAKRSHLQREISLLKEEIERHKQAVEIEWGKINRQHKIEIDEVEDKIKRALTKKDEVIQKLKEEIQIKETQVYKYKELLQKQRSELLK